MSATYDLAVVGAGIVGLGHALAAVRLGRRVVVIDREARAIGASVRNFGFVTVTGQQHGECWRRAMRSRDVWVEAAGAAGIAIEHEGFVFAAYSREAFIVLEQFMATEMGEGCRLYDRPSALAAFEMLRPDGLVGALWSPHERRVEAREAIGRVAAWLEQAWGVTFLRGAAVHEVAPPLVMTSRGVIEAGAVAVCTGDAAEELFPEALAPYALTKCKLHMLRLAPQGRGWRLPGAIMRDESIVRYLGYSELPGAEAMIAKVRAERPALLEHGVHLIVVQSADGSLVVGDSHHYHASPDPFQPEAVDRLIVDLADETLRLSSTRVVERWTGVYASAPDRLMLVDAPTDRVRVTVVTSGTGMSTAFAIGEEVVGELFGAPVPNVAG